MRRLGAHVLGFSLLLGAVTAVPAAPPNKIEIKYDLLNNGLRIGDATTRMEWGGGSYSVVEQVRGRGVFALKGDATRSSAGAVAADGLRPRKFEDRRTGREPLQAQFNPAAKTPTLQQQDQLSLPWSFAFAPPRKAVGVSVADGKDITRYTFQPAGRERIKTPAGEFDALKFVKKRARPDDKATELWIAAERRIPVRILIVDKDGARFDQVAAKISAQ
jgi:hypothetical protein